MIAAKGRGSTRLALALSSGMAAIIPLVLSGLLGIGALGLGVTAVIVFLQNRQPPEQAKQEKNGADGQPNQPNAPPVPPEKQPEPQPPPKEKEPEPKGQPRPQPPTPGTRPGVHFTRLATFTVSPPPAKPKLDDKPTPEQIRHIEAPLPTIKRIFPPANPATEDTFVLTQTAAALGDSGEKLALDTYGPAGNRIATARIEELIDELRARYAIVIVTHSMQQAARVSQRTAFFHLGKIVEYGKTSDIFTNPREERTKDYITGRYG